jgi:hypothetical protein
VSRIEKIIDGLLKLQDIILKNERDLVGDLLKDSRDIGNVAQIEIYDEESNYSVRLKLDEGYRIVKTNEEPIHVIRMHIDTLLDLILGERGGRPFDFGRAYAEGWIQLYGKDYHIHAMRFARDWEKAFKRFRKYLKVDRR